MEWFRKGKREGSVNQPAIAGKTPLQDLGIKLNLKQKGVPMGVLV